jgi:hypothetical protein
MQYPETRETVLKARTKLNLIVKLGKRRKVLDDPLPFKLQPQFNNNGEETGENTS